VVDNDLVHDEFPNERVEKLGWRRKQKAQKPNRNLPPVWLEVSQQPNKLSHGFIASSKQGLGSFSAWHYILKTSPIRLPINLVEIAIETANTSMPKTPMAEAI
jgi:hypothetical protein